MIQLAVREIDTKQRKALQYKMLPVSLEKITSHFDDTVILAGSATHSIVDFTIDPMIPISNNLSN